MVLGKANKLIIGNLEKFFYVWGKFVARHPLIVILGSLVFTGLCCLGFLKMRFESRAEKLWIPTDSQYIPHKAWMDENFPTIIRNQIALFHNEDNVLQPKILLQMLDLHKTINALQVNNRTYEDLCFRIPIADIFLNKKRRRRRKRQAESAKQTTTEKSTKLATPIPLNQLTTAKTVKNISDNKGSDSDTRVQNATTSSTTTTLSSTTTTSLSTTTTSSSTTTTTTLSSTTTSTEDDNDYDYDYDYEYDYDYSKVGDTSSDLLSESESQKFEEDLPPDIYCDLVNTLNEKCFEHSLLEIWNYDEERIRELTQEDILFAVNVLTESPHFGFKTNYSNLLGAIQRNESGHIIGAKSVIHTWLVSLNQSQAVQDDQQVGIELDLADPDTLDWELLVIENMLGKQKQYEEEEGTALYALAHRSYNDISADAIFFDGIKMAIGYFIMFAYVTLLLGRLNLVEHRFYLTGAGIVAVAMGVAISFGLSGAFGLPMTPFSAILPFLCVGIGIDDMFVIMQCWYNLDGTPEAEGKTLAEKLGLTLMHAGVAITVTSVTDVCAFGIGAVTILPGLQAFCVSCAIGIGAIYILQASWFVAWMALDQRRIEAHRDGMVPCYVHKSFEANACSRGEWGKAISEKFASLIKYRAYKILVLIVTLGFVGIGAWGTFSIRQHFDPVLLLPQDSYLMRWIRVSNRDYPENGWEATVLLGPFEDLDESLLRLDRLIGDMEELVEEGKYLKSVDPWWSAFKTFLAERKNITDFHSTLGDNGTLRMLLSDFLFSREGSKYKFNFQFNDELVCNEPAPNVTASSFKIKYFKFAGPEEHIPGKRHIEDLIKKSNISETAFSFSKVYAAWETDEVIGTELWRNLGMAMVAVFLITLVLLADLQICLMVMLCVILTLVDMVGHLHFWNITIDTLSCVNIILAIGLCVDYSAHIAHAFIVAKGNRTERAMQSLIDIGPAVANGGITTFLALVLLGFSESHVFVTFFKVFLLTVVFGLFHGLIFFPVVLSFIGPRSTADTSSVSDVSATSTDPDRGSPDSAGQTGVKNIAYIASEDEVLPGEKASSPRRVKSLFTPPRTASWDVKG